MKQEELDNWYGTINIAQRKQNAFTKYSTTKNNMTKAQKRKYNKEIDLIIKNERINYWEKNHKLPSENTLLWNNKEVEA